MGLQNSGLPPCIKQIEFARVQTAACLAAHLLTAVHCLKTCWALSLSLSLSLSFPRWHSLIGS